MVRRGAVLAAAAAAVVIVVVAIWVRPAASTRATTHPSSAVHAYSVTLYRPGKPPPAACRELAGPRRPRLVIVGASFTAGVGPGPSRSWAVLLARRLGWDAVVYGDPGAGYVRRGAGHEGPVAAEVARVDLRALKPSLVIVQAGHDDIGVPPGLERRQVGQAIALIHAGAPQARIALITVFAGRSRPAAAYRTDQAIVRAARAADPAVIVMDPLAAGWTFPRVRDGLHPTAAGSAWIASQAAAVLRDHGVRPATTRGGAIICELTPRR